MMEIDKPVQTIKGIGPKTSQLLSRINIFTIKDLLTHFPRSYEDRSRIRVISQLVDGEVTSVTGEVCLIDRGRYTRNGKHMSKIVFRDGTGYISCIWFNQKFIIKSFKIGESYKLFGKVSISFGEKVIVNPEYEKFEQDDHSIIIPIYPLTKNLSQKILRNAIYDLINSSDFEMNDVFPEKLLNEYNLCSISEAMKNIHFPDDISRVKSAEKRIKFEELLILQLSLMMEKFRINSNFGISIPICNDLKEFVENLSFKLTNAQKKCINQILKDMSSNMQMNRLVQGDVGSGKTIVAMIALFNCVKNGYQGALMAPTEILASQHYKSMLSLYSKWGIRIELLSAKITKKQKDQIKERIKTGETDIVIGTHALLQDDVEFKNLALVVTDEQHRFGVRQRAILGEKGINPDVLVMTATPIPRTLALFIYGDLDISIIDELPPGRQKIDTYAVRTGQRGSVYKFIKDEVIKGRQAYVVCPLIEESDVLDANSAIELAEKLKDEYLKGIRVGLLHGRMKDEEKDSIMESFKIGEIDVLVSTTVIEVGINVPNASVMVVENADRFGLAQLHQLRGRVGRGEQKSYCILISDMESEVSRKRMKIMKESSDGFIIAQKDMEIRGTGEFFGLKQHGLPELKLADMFKDTEILQETNDLAKQLLSSKEIFSSDFEKLRSEINGKFLKYSNSVAFN